MSSTGHVLSAYLFLRERLLYLMLLCALTLQCWQADAQPYAYQFNHLTVNEGLSHTDANCIAQDQKGYVWIGTLFGINRFDGYTVKRYYNSNEPLQNAYKNRVKYLLPENNGLIWVSTEGGLQQFDTKTEKYTEYPVAGARAQPTFVKLVRSGTNFIFNLSDGELTRYKISGRQLLRQPVNIPAGLNFSDMAGTGDGNLLLASATGVFRLDNEGTFHRLMVQGLPERRASHIYLNKQKEVLISFSNKLYAIRKLGTDNFKVIRTYTAPQGMNLLQVGEETNGHYWLNGSIGLINLDHDLNELQVITSKTPGVGLQTRSLTDLLIDRSQCLWVSAFGGGVSYRDLNAKKFLTFQHHDSDGNSITSSYVRCVLEEPQKGLWIGTDMGLNFYDYHSKRNIRYHLGSSIALPNNNILSLAFDQEKNLWIGTGIGISILRADRQGLLQPMGHKGFPEFSIETLARDVFGNMWFGNHTNSSGVIWKTLNGSWQVRYSGEGYFILPEEKRPEVFISSTHGLRRVFVDNKGQILKTYYYRAGKRSGLSSDYTYPVAKQNDSIYWVGTIGGGLNRLILHSNTYETKRYNAKEGVFNDVESLEIDRLGRVWMGGNGLLCLEPGSGKVTHYDKYDGLQGNSFKVGASFKGSDGKLYFGGTNGLNYFEPEVISASSQKVHPVLTDMLINNQRPVYSQRQGTGNYLPCIVTYSKQIRLDHRQNNFVLSFSAMHFGNPLKCRYRYQLIGYDKDWKYTDGTNPNAFYSNLDYKAYRFVVEATNPDGVWTREQATVAIAVDPPWFKSTFATVIYILLFASGLAWIYIYQARWYQLKKELAVRAVNETKREEMHAQREVLYQQQLQFFTNISHELRTPLTLILGPLERLLNEHQQGPMTSSFQLMFRNIKRLVNLINELMNFKKTADQAVKLQVRELPIFQLAEGLCREFAQLAASKEINLHFSHAKLREGAEETLGFFDEQILEKILFNLLSNAIKYTDTGGSVSFRIFFDRAEFQAEFTTAYHLLNENYHAGRYVYFLVADTGVGISEGSINKIFDRYYQIGNNHLGSGVGLALVKLLTQLHKGNISVYSERNKGTQFLVALPWGAENYQVEERWVDATAHSSRLERTDILPVTQISTDDNHDRQQENKIDKHILLVDDNAELRVFLRQALDKYYFITEAADGEEAIRIAMERSPDIIISDVMMPGMTGIEFCRRIKDRFETSHIPFIILSAKDALETRIEGMTSGADHYFAKPFSVDLLVLTVHNIFSQSEKLKLRYSRDYLTTATELVHSEKDKEFMTTLLNLIEAHIENPNLDVDLICNHLFISRSKLYQKIKSISDQSIGDFIKTIRLKKAIRLMTHEVIPLNEVAYRCGFQSQGYFSRVFKKEFGNSPSEYLRDLRGEGTIR
jgi:signal transduction histidine kinase/DNA-binding response OmpR family regulator/ligand-binding sensor domain-containing protein